MATDDDGYELLMRDMLAAARRMVRLSLDPPKPEEPAPGAFESQDAKNYAQAALSLTQGYCTARKARTEGAYRGR